MPLLGGLAVGGRVESSLDSTASPRSRYGGPQPAGPIGRGTESRRSCTDRSRSRIVAAFPYTSVREPRVSHSLNSVAHWVWFPFGAVRRFIARSGKRVAVTVVGFVLLLAGIVMIVTPGPGILLIIAGLGRPRDRVRLGRAIAESDETEGRASKGHDHQAESEQVKYERRGIRRPSSRLDSAPDANDRAARRADELGGTGRRRGSLSDGATGGGSSMPSGSTRTCDDYGAPGPFAASRPQDPRHQPSRTRLFILDGAVTPAKGSRSTPKGTRSAGRTSARAGGAR